LWNKAGEIVAFEVEDHNHSLMTIKAADVVESGVTAQVITQYYGKEVWKEVVSYDPRIEDTMQFEDWSRGLEDAIGAYNETETPVTEYIDFLVSLFAFKQVQGIGARETLEAAASESQIDLDKARSFLRHMVSPSIRAKGLDIEAILSPQMVSYLQADQAMLTSGENSAKAPGGIDFNLDLLELEIQGQDANFKLPINNINFENIHIDGLMPVIINITPITNLPIILGAAEREEQQELSSVR
jgi:hypothetical protein